MVIIREMIMALRRLKRAQKREDKGVIDKGSREGRNQRPEEVVS
jgi:hypothetical protein